MDDKNSGGRCPWCGDDPLYVKYHDEEWGKAVTEVCRQHDMLFLSSGLRFYR